jgi:signal transduction histidine kinase
VYEQQGSGLGLTVARRLTEIHGGHVAFESEYGKGTTVTVSLPLAPDEESQPAEETVTNA